MPTDRLPQKWWWPPNNPGDNYLISQLDQNNPVVACDPRVDQEDTYLMDGVTDIHDPRVVHTQVNSTYDGDDQGVTPYDYGNISDTSTSGADLGTGVYVDAHDTTYPHDNIDGGIFLTDLPAVSQVRNGSGTPSSCSQFVYGNLSQYNTSPDVPGITQAQTHTVGGTSGCADSSNLITVLHSYDTSGNLVSSTDGDTHLGCTIGSSSYSACATYDASTYDTHIVGAANALNQQAGSVYDPGSAGGFGQWLTSLTDV
ncbi:MAG TPA: hypothetical protein VFA09_07655, partial [Ktedonobacteraceae bacterium]|nr:hypothetical protein [Ktedonobacteraceae bacterium]